MPQKNSVAYALLVTLFRGTENGNEFMRKKELIHAAETSRLSRVSIVPEKAKGKAESFGSSPRDWYSGWSCMKMLITRGLVVKSSCPAKYMLMEKGKEVAQECLSRSGIIDANKSSYGLEGCPNSVQGDTMRVDMQNLECVVCVSVEKAVSFSSKTPKRLVDVPPKHLDKVMTEELLQNLVLYRKSHEKAFLLLLDRSSSYLERNILFLVFFFLMRRHVLRLSFVFCSFFSRLKRHRLMLII